ncbi:MAG: ribonuclease H family protein [Muribaculaceae bacterium]|nr:ribonuclease H family protein [Muribaculaceae bacterium]
MAGKKWYVVFQGRHTGVFDSWDECKEYIEGFPGAKYKSYPSQEDAVNAYRRGVPGDDEQTIIRQIFSHTEPEAFNAAALPSVDINAIAVDASCLGNPGVMEYRGVSLKTGQEIFRVGPYYDATNNIGEFLALIHALALLKKQGDTTTTIYSDSKTALSWLSHRQVKTTLKPSAKNAPVLELLRRAIAWMNSNTYPNRVLKWKTEIWGEIPADFGRK